MFRLLKILPVVLAIATTQLPAQDSRAGSFELNGSIGAMYFDGTFANYFSRNGFSTDGRFAPAVSTSLGYNISNRVSFGLGIVGSRETRFKSTIPYLETTGGRYLSPSVSLSYSPNLNARFSPFVTGGAQFTRVSSSTGQKTHPTWGSFVGAGFRIKTGDQTNLKFEARLSPEHYAEFDYAKTSYNGTALLGLSYSIGGNRAKPKPVIQYIPSKPDTVYVTDTVRIAAKPIIIKDTLVLEGVNFEFDSDRLLDDSKEILNRVAVALNKSQWSNVRFEVAGHTSRVGSDAWNQDLSQRRAESVSAYLISRGVNANRMVAKGYGETRLLIQESENGDDPRNRRVELRRIN